MVSSVREHYLRDDIPCGLLGCPGCSLLPSPGGGSGAEYRPCLSGDAEEVVLIDLSTALHQLDLLEHPAMKNVVLLQSVLEEVRTRSLPTFQRLKALLETPDKFFYCFSNEHHHRTFCPRLPGEAPSQRLERSLRSAARWYAEHLAPLDVRAVLVRLAPTTTEQEAEQEGEQDLYVAETIEQHVERSLSLTHPETADLVAGCAAARGSLSDDASSLEYPLAPESCPAYQSAAEVLLGLKSGRLLQGTFHADQDDFSEGYVSSYGKVAMRVLVRGSQRVNRAIEGDVVAVQPDQGVGSSSSPSSSSSTLSSNDASDLPPQGRIVGIIRRLWKPYCGAVLWEEGETETERQAIDQPRVLVFGCVDQRVPPICIRSAHPDALKDQRIVVGIDAWLPGERYPRGHLIRKLGSMSNRETETQSLLTQFQVRTAAFPPKVMACLPTDSWQIPAEERARRQDLRHLRVCSIDPPGCTDIDDALHAFRLPNGNYEVGVHIADVTYFVTHDSPIDVEARLRSVTVYLVDRRIQMLPEILGTNLCSLRSDVERLAFSCIWELTPDAQVVSVRFCKSVILSKASFTYAQAKTRIDDPNASDPLSQDLRTLLQLSKILRRRREEQGALMLASPEIKFKHKGEEHGKSSSGRPGHEEEDQEEGPSTDPVDIEMYKQSEANYLVEEFMLLANISVAKKILRHYPSFALLRRHPKPQSALLADLNKQLLHTGIQLDLTSSKTLAASLDAAQRKDPFFNTLLRILVTRQMNQAIYFSAGTVPASDFNHYGLAQDIYTHFTSPIRRYADVIVHRLLAAAIDVSPLPNNVNKDSVQRICHSINRHHRQAQHASIASAALYTHIFFKNKEIFEDAYVIRIRPDRMTVLIRSYGFEGTIPFDKNHPELQHLTFDEASQSVRFHGASIALFDVIPVKLTVTSKPPLGDQLTITPVFSQLGQSQQSVVVKASKEPIPPRAKRSRRI